MLVVGVFKWMIVAFYYRKQRNWRKRNSTSKGKSKTLRR